MKILFSPSETKINGGEENGFDKNSFIFPEFFEKRLEIINSYNKFLEIASNDELSKLFGTKKKEIIEKYRIDIFKNPIMKAIKRYEGVAYDYLSYNNLEESAQKYIDNNVLIFSNLFGVLKASDKIPDYKLKQGETFLNLKIEKFYNDNFSNILDKYLQDEDILDLRAGFYEKFYTLKKPYLTMKFIKDGKVVSHFAKAYRGEILKTLAQNSINTFADLMNLELKILKIEEIKEQKFKREIVYSINQG
ncbi:YaaA family protein [Aliarcobacter lanthieri]|uniref:YaaA family protein n=1 Tax=Aliarcobacter lanthieri TaxID=1355374 RepID=UPI00047BB1BA|nr:YaaA family protein [Aliarcobacter lanthieri]QKF60246.1 peroxide stress protein YaaA [Aliarcobacter lanthieri]